MNAFVYVNDAWVLASLVTSVEARPWDPPFLMYGLAGNDTPEFAPRYETVLSLTDGRTFAETYTEWDAARRRRDDLLHAVREAAQLTPSPTTANGGSSGAMGDGP